MKPTAWADALEKLKDDTFKIKTPAVGGTGFMLTRVRGTQISGIATAYHVIGHAAEWEEPIPLHHQKSKKGRHSNDRMASQSNKSFAILANK